MNDREHQAMVELLSAYLDGELVEVERQKLERRLEQDADLRLQLEDLRRIGDAVRSESVPSPPRDLAARIRRTLDQEQTPVSRRTWRWRSWQTPLAAAATIVVALMIGVLIKQDQIPVEMRAVKREVLSNEVAIEKPRVDEAIVLADSAEKDRVAGLRSLGYAGEDQPAPVEGQASGGAGAPAKSSAPKAAKGPAVDQDPLVSSRQDSAKAQAPAPVPVPVPAAAAAPPELESKGRSILEERRERISAPAAQKKKSRAAESPDRAQGFGLAQEAFEELEPAPWSWSPQAIGEGAAEISSAQQLRRIVESLGGRIEPVPGTTLGADSTPSDSTEQLFRITLDRSQVPQLRRILGETGTLQATDATDPLWIRIP